MDIDAGTTSLFMNAIKTGIQKNENRKINLKEVEDLLSEVECSLNSFLKSENVSLFQVIGDRSRAIALKFNERELKVGLLKFSEEIYPLSIEYFGIKEDCISESELTDAIRNMISSSNFGDYLKRLMVVLNVSRDKH